MSLRDDEIQVARRFVRIPDIDEIVLLNVVPAAGPPRARIRTIAGDIADTALLRRVVGLP